MTRKIKFRAWIPKPVNYAYTEKNEGGVMFYQEDQYLGSFLRRANTIASNKEHDSYVGDEDLILLQYTGLKDKNGKEIYEGDILQLHCGSADGVFEGAKVKAEVLWKEDRFSAVIPDKTVKVSGGEKDGEMVAWREMHTWVGSHTCLREWQKKLEVIGNVYENPELLK